MISICMASYNGSRYVKEQLKSILLQIESDDEIIVVDDASTDNTISIIESINDNRLKLYVNPKNIGVIGSFERSILLARGDVIFLSDQDDIWLPGKVSKIMNVFSKNIDVTLCLSDALIIDGKSTILEGTYFNRRGGFKRGVISNIAKNKFLGCSIAFKASLVNHILPFPRNIPAHDMWVGIINEIYGKSEYINEPLFHYRRHDKNVSSMKHESILKMLKWRIILIYQLLKRVISIYFN